MNMTFIENLELTGIQVSNCKTIKEFMHELKNYVNYTEEYFHGCTFKQYMNNEYDENDTYKSVEDNVHEDVFIWIEYTDGSHFCYCDSREGNFKLNGIKCAYISDGNGYTVYKYDLQEEWKRVEETLTEEEAEAVENGIDLTALKFHKDLKAEEQEATPEEETTKSTENSAEEATEEVTEGPEAEEQEATPEEETTNSTENSVFRYKINILETLKKAGYTSTRIRKEKLFAQVTLQKFRTGDTNISLQTVADICNLTKLQPWDILEFLANDTENSAEEVTEKPEAEEQEATPTEETAKNTENSAEEVTEEVTKEPEAEEHETINFEIPENLESEEIEKLDLTVRTYNALKRANINKIGDLKQIKTMSEFKQKVGSEDRLIEIKTNILIQTWKIEDEEI